MKTMLQKAVETRLLLDEIMKSSIFPLYEAFMKHQGEDQEVVIDINPVLVIDYVEKYNKLDETGE